MKVDDHAVLVLKDEDDRHTVDVEVLARVLLATQEAAWALAPDLEGATERAARAYAKERFRLRAEIPRDGSYAVPLALAPLQTSLDFLPILTRLSGLWETASNRDFETLSRAVDPSRWDRLKAALLDMMPRGFRVGFGPDEGRAHYADECTANALATFIAADAAPTREEADVFVAEVRGLGDFGAQAFTLSWPLTRRVIKGSYGQAHEEQLYRARRQLSVIRGTVERAPDGTPLRVSRLESVEVVDTSPIVLDRVKLGGTWYQADPPVVANVLLEEPDKQTFVAQVPELRVDATGRTRAELRQNLEEQLDFIWGQFVLDDSTPLTRRAQALADALRARFATVLDLGGKA